MRFLTVRAVRTLLTLLGVVTLTFVLGRLSGDPVATMLPQTATLDDFTRERARLGLDLPMPAQYVLYLRNLVSGDLGRSIVYNRSALEVVMERVPATLALGIPSLLISIALGLLLGVGCAVWRNGWLDRVTLMLTLIGQSLPPFFVGIALILVFAVLLRWLPPFGSDTPRHYILPTFTLTIYPLAVLVRLTRASMLDVLGEDYIRTAYAKGARQWRVVTRHALRNALISVVTVIGLQVAGILSGAAIIETVFAWPGIGSLAVNAIGGRDFPVVQCIVLVSAASFAITNLGVDLLYSWLDPRIRAA